MKTRANWNKYLWKICYPVLSAAASGKLKALMPLESNGIENRSNFSHLEAVARVLSGASPWLEKDLTDIKEIELQSKARSLAQATLDLITDPKSQDYLNFNEGAQPLVDAAYLAQAMLRAPNILWNQLSLKVKQQIINSLVSTRRVRPYFNNWLLFSAIIEAFFFKIGVKSDLMRIDYALRQMDQWYVGDGMYSDGPSYRNDFYNSYVIHPFLLDIISATKPIKFGNNLGPQFLKRAQRYAEVLERMISPEGTMPSIGRSITYRCGNLHALGHLALTKQLPTTLKPAQVRCAMDAVIKRTLLSKNTFDENSWLNIGLIGSQPSLSEDYISTGSLYLSTLAFLPLGLGSNDPFWTEPDVPFSNQILYEGIDTRPDQALKENFLQSYW